MSNPNLPALSPAGARQLMASLTKAPPGDDLRTSISLAEAWQVQATSRHQDLAQRMNAGARNLTRPVAIWNETMAAFRAALDGARSRLATPTEAVREPVAKAKTRPAKPVASEKSSAASPAEKLSGLDAAALVLRDAGQPMNVQEVLAQVLERRLWTTSGKTPAATLYAAMIREIAAKGSQSRFQKVDRGRFAAA